jgi:hypothetical protein
MKKVFFAMMMVVAVALSGCELWHSWSNWKWERLYEPSKDYMSLRKLSGEPEFSDSIQMRTCSRCGAVEKRNINTPVK